MALFEGKKQWKPCPECGEDALEGTGLIFPGSPVCSECGHEPDKGEVKRSFREVHAEVRERMGVGEGYDEERVNGLVESAEGDSVSEKTLLTPISPAKDAHLIDYLDSDEQPHYVIKGGTIDVEGGGDSSSLFGDDRSRKVSLIDGCYTVVTDKRVYCIVQQVTGNDERNIDYNAVTGVDLDTGVVNNRLTIHTKGRTYHFSGFHTSKDECRGAMDYIRQKKNSTTNRRFDADDPIERLERLEDLHERGTLSDEEFAEMKSEIIKEP